MSLFTVQVKLPHLNPSNPQEPIFCHLAVPASSQAAALAFVERTDYKGMPAKVVPPLGMPCRADLSWDPV